MVSGDGHRARGGRRLRPPSAPHVRGAAVPGVRDAGLGQRAYIMAGVQSAIFDLREEVDHKIGRLPLNYFDTHPRGELLSRVTNDIDNVSELAVDA